MVLSFIVVNAERQAPELVGLPIERMDLARTGTTSAPNAIAAGQVLEHGLRHLAWLAKEDPTVRSALNDEWHRVLSNYVPEPFRHLA